MAFLSNYALHLQASLLNELRIVFINVAVAEKLAALRTGRYFRERAGRADPADFLAALEKAGTDVAIEGDELPGEE